MYAMSFVDLPRALLHHVDLRFPKQEEELLYKESVQQTLVFAALVMNTIFIAGYIIGSLPAGPKILYFSSDTDDPRTLSAWCSFVGIFVVPMLVSMIAVLRLRCKLFRSLNWEIVITVCSSITSTAFIVYTGWMVATLYGKDPERVWGTDVRYSEGDVLLFLDAITTMTCLFIPVRMIFKLVTPVISLLVFGALGKIIGSPYPSRFDVRTFALAALTFCALWGAWENERVARRNFVAQGLMRTASQLLERQHESSARILRSLSDALLLLTHDLQIINSDPCFAAMMFSSQPHVLTGTPFTDYLASDEDRERFTSALKTSCSIADLQKTDRCSGTLHVNCRDTHGRSFGVYVYYTRSFVSDCDQGYMVALVEAQERETQRGIERHTCPNFLQLECSGDHMNDEDTASMPSAGAGSSELVADAVVADVAVWVDVSSVELRIIRCSAGFTQLGPITEGTGLSSMIVGNSKHLLKPWLEGVVNAFGNGESVPDEDFQLRLRTTPTSSSEFTARCRIDLASPILIDEITEGDCLARVVFSHLECHRRQSYRRYMSSSASASVCRSYNNAEAVHLSL